MVAYSFKARFVDPILSGRKRQTIRAERKRHAWPEEEVQLYQGMRTKACRLIGKAICQRNLPIVLCFHAVFVSIGRQSRITNRWELDDFAVRDGFLDWEQMADFWLNEHPNAYRAGEFRGVLITWGDLTVRGAP